MTLDPSTPVIIGVAQVTDRVDDPEVARTPVELMTDALRSAAIDAGAPTALAGLDLVAAVGGMWRYRDPGRQVATAVGADAAGPDPTRVGLYHFAWEMESFEDVKRLYGELKEKGVRIAGIGDHGISLGVYFFDPDGNEIEAFYELPRDQWPTEGAIFSGRFPLGSLEEERTARRA